MLKTLRVGAHDIVLIDAGDIFQHERTAARSLSLISEARVPLEDAEDTRIAAFRPQDGGIEHLAIVIGSPDPSNRADSNPLRVLHRRPAWIPAL